MLSWHDRRGGLQEGDHASMVLHDDNGVSNEVLYKSWRHGEK
jgi:hypothetical protein